MPDPAGTTPGDTQLAGMYSRGSSVRAIAAACGLPPKTVHRRLTAAGVRLRPAGGHGGRGPSRPLSELDMETIAAAYQASPISLEALGAQYGRSGSAIARVLRHKEVPVRPRGRTLAAGPARQVPADLVSSHQRGLRPADIAERAPGADAGHIARALRSAGLTPHRGRPLPAAADLTARYAAAGSVRGLARQLRVDEERIRGALAAAGVPAGSLRCIPDRLRGRAVRLVAAGIQGAELAATLGIPEDATRRLGQAPGTALGHRGAA